MKTPSTTDRDELFNRVKFTVKQYMEPHDIVIAGAGSHAPMQDAQANVE
jgi:hypothetical protein